MRIVFLGTAAGLPQPNRRCSCIMVEIAGNYYFLDMGMTPAAELASRGIAMEAVKGIFISHLHGDHVDGLVNFADLISWYYTKSSPAIFLPDIKAAKTIGDWLSVIGIKDQRSLDYREIAEGVIFEDEVLKVTAIRTEHWDKSYAFLLEAEGKTFLFTSDLKWQGECTDFPQIAWEKEIDVAVCEAAHVSPMDYLPVLKHGKIKKVYFIHHGFDRYPDIITLQEKMKELPIVVVYDNMEVVL